MTIAPSVTVRVSRRFPWPAERVFDAFLDPGVAGKFLFATPEGDMVRTDIDPRVGGRFSFTDRRDGEEVEHTGEYLEIDRPRRLSFRFAVPKYAPDMTRVTIEITPHADGCELVLTHEGVWADFAERTETGWGMILDALARVLA